MPPVFTWNSASRQYTIESTKEVIQSLEPTLADPDQDLNPYREGMQKERDAAASYLKALMKASADSNT